MFSILLLALVVTVSGASKGSVVTLSTKNFFETVKNSEDDMGWLVKFYAPWSVNTLHIIYICQSSLFTPCNSSIFLFVYVVDYMLA